MAFAAGEAADSELSYDPNRELLGSKESCQGLAFGVSMRQGSRPYMEDVTVAQPVPQHANFMVSAFAVRATCSDCLLTLFSLDFRRV